MFQALLDWLDEHLPVFCSACNRPVSKQKAIYERRLVGGVVPLCPKCHTRIFNAFDN